MTEHTDFNLGKRIEDLLYQNKMHKNQLAEKIGINPLSVTNIINRKDTKLSYIKLIANAFDLSLLEFFSYSNEKKDAPEISKSELEKLYKSIEQCESKLKESEQKKIELYEDLRTTTNELFEIQKKLAEFEKKGM